MSEESMGEADTSTDGAVRDDAATDGTVTGEASARPGPGSSPAPGGAALLPAPAAGPGASRAAWVRYGDPITQEQLEFAAGKYAVAILQPWETEAARWLKEHSPQTLLICYKCLSSTRDYEPGPVYSSGVGYREAPDEWFARRLDGERIQWNNYGGHWQMQVWNPEYRRRWVQNVVAELEDSPFDGVMADNDVYEDYYGIRPPVQGAASMADFRAGLDLLVAEAGQALNAVGKVLVPNIAESRRDEGKWARHSAYGGGFEEVWLGWSPEDFFDPMTVQAQIPQLEHESLCVARVPARGPEDPSFLYAVAALWVFGAGRNIAVTATGHDQYSGTPFIPEQLWDLGRPVGRVVSRGSVWSRRFTDGWAAVNFRESRRPARVRVPEGLVDAEGRPAPQRVTLHSHQGAVYRTAAAHARG